jgi:hypothetical protein
MFGMQERNEKKIQGKYLATKEMHPLKFYEQYE